MRQVAKTDHFICVIQVAVAVPIKPANQVTTGSLYGYIKVNGIAWLSGFAILALNAVFVVFVLFVVVTAGAVGGIVFSVNLVAKV